MLTLTTATLLAAALPQAGDQGLLRCPKQAVVKDGLDRLVEDQMKASIIPGAAVAVVQDGRVTKVGVYGTANLEWGACVDPNTRFQLASATKIFTGVLLMRLVEQGRVKLDDPLTRWFPDAPSAWRDIKVRQLANHTSGLADDLGSRPQRTVDEIVAAAKVAPLAYVPGTEARYGFTDFVVLRALMERASGKNLPDLLRDEITTPLRMSETAFELAKEEGSIRIGRVLPRRAAVYGLEEDRLVTSDFFFAPHGYGAGGLYSSIRDLSTFFAALDQGRLLKPQSLIQLETPALLPNGKKSGFGVGWTARSYRGAAVVGHSGGPALADVLRLKDRKVTVLALTNQRVLYPLLAEAIIDTYLPATKPPQAVPDSRPQITRRVRDFLLGAPVADAGFGPGQGMIAQQFASPFATALLRGVGPLRSLRLIEVKDRVRRYEAVFARKTMDWLVREDAQGRLVELRPA